MSRCRRFKRTGKLARVGHDLPAWGYLRGHDKVATRNIGLVMRISFAVAMAVTCSPAAIAAGTSGLSGLFSEQPIVEATRKGSVSDTQAALIDGASANARADDGTPVLVIAAKSENADLVRLLVENGARPDDKAKDETTALTLASSNGNLEIVSYLLDHGADVNETGSLRETAIIKATRARQNPVIRLLVAKGADLEETDATGATALEIAERAGWQDTAALLKKAGPK